VSKDKLAWTAAPRPVPMTVTVGSFALLASAGLFLINGLPLFDTSQYPKFPGSAVAVLVVFFAIFTLVMVLIPLLAAIFALRGSRWPAFLAGGFAILMIVGVIGAHPIYIAGATAALFGAVLLWLPSARAYRRATMRNRENQVGLSKEKGRLG
jgi:hypothetical protein